jgi:alpha-L-arabinofuranosidase
LHAIKVVGIPAGLDGLDVAASRRDNVVFLHVANTQPTRAVTAALQVAGSRIRAGRVFEIAEDPTVELSYLNSGDVMKAVEKPMSASAVWEFPAASVSAIELEIAPSL